MKVYYLQSEYEVNKHRIVLILYDDMVYKYDLSTLSPYGVLNIDKIDPDNKAICRDLVWAHNKIDVEGEGKYHIEIEASEPVLYEKDGWEEYVENGV